MDVVGDVSLHKILQLCGQITGKLAIGADMYLLCLKCVVHVCKTILDAVLKFSGSLTWIFLSPWGVEGETDGGSIVQHVSTAIRN